MAYGMLLYNTVRKIAYTYYSYSAGRQVEFGGKYYYKCGCVEYAPHHHTAHLNRLCYDCRTTLIGTRQTVVRYGNLPACGQSYNYQLNRHEIGISCYFFGDTPRPEFAGRKATTLSAIVIGTGGDDEPLIDADTITYI